MSAVAKSFSAVLLLGLLSACSSGGGGGGKDQGLTGKPTGDTGCAYTFDQGGTVALSLPASDLRVTFFDKKLDLSRLRAIGQASARSTFEFMKADGVDAYHVRSGDENASCLLFQPIPSAQGALKKIWTDVKVEGGVILGLFLPLDRSSKAGLNRPAILLRVDTDRYTLVHEYMHYVFNKVREARGYSDGELTGRVGRQGTRFMDAYKAIPEDSSRITRGQAVELIDSWLALTKSMVELNENFALEEMSIEAVLQDADKAGVLGQVLSYDRENSGEYVSSSAKSADDSLKTFGGMKDAITGLADALGESARKEDIRAVGALIDRRRAEIAAVNAKYGKKSGSSKLSSGLAAADLSPLSCGRSKLLKDRFAGQSFPKLNASSF